MQKNYIRAAFFSAFIFPGFGQWYLNRKIRAAIMILLILAVTFSLFLNLALVLYPKVNHDVMVMMSAGQAPGPGDMLRYAVKQAGPYSKLVWKQFTVHLVMLVILWLYSIIDVFFIFHRDKDRIQEVN